MTNEQEKAKELAKLLTAFADGKTIQYEYKGKWHNCQDNMWGIHDMSVKYNTRIKPGTKRIALNQQDLIDRELSGKTVSLFYDDTVLHILKYNSQYVVLINGFNFDYEYLKNNYTFLDGSPCYKEVDCE